MKIILSVLIGLSFGITSLILCNHLNVESESAGFIAGSISQFTYWVSLGFKNKSQRQ